MRTRQQDNCIRLIRADVEIPAHGYLSALPAEGQTFAAGQRRIPLFVSNLQAYHLADPSHSMTFEVDDNLVALLHPIEHVSSSAPRIFAFAIQCIALERAKPCCDALVFKPSRPQARKSDSSQNIFQWLITEWFLYDSVGVVGNFGNRTRTKEAMLWWRRYKSMRSSFDWYRATFPWMPRSLI